jgi:hypothetical protein
VARVTRPAANTNEEQPTTLCAQGYQELSHPLDRQAIELGNNTGRFVEIPESECSVSIHGF